MAIIKHHTPFIVVIFAIAIFFQYFNDKIADVTWLTWCAEQVLSGKKLYIDVLESNPPLIIWLYIPAVFLAKLFSADAFFAVRLETFFLSAISIFICSILIKKSDIFSDRRRNFFITITAGALLLLPSNPLMFAQREHLFIILSLPYIFLNLPSVNINNIKIPIKIVIGLMAGIGFCIKPHFFAVFIAILAHQLFYKKSILSLITIPNLIICATPIIYIFSIYLFVPQFFDWLKIMLVLYPEYTPVSDPNIYKNLLYYYCTFVCALIAGKMIDVFNFSAHGKYGKNIIYLMFVAIGEFIITLSQFKGFYYHYYPFFAICVLMFGMVALSLDFSNYKPRYSYVRKFAIFWTFFLAFSPASSFDFHSSNYNEKLNARIENIVSKYQTTPYVYFISPRFDLPANFYSIDGKIRWQTNTNYFLYLIMGIMEKSKTIANEPTLPVREGREHLERWLLDNIANDIEKKRPETMVLVKNWQIGYQENDFFDFIEWFKRDERLSNILTKYELKEYTELCEDEQYPKNKSRCDFYIFSLKPITKPTN